MGKVSSKGAEPVHPATIAQPFCYPTDDRDSPKMIGYLLYLKLSLTGNDGESIRRYRLDERALPHHSTADQFFTEAQFETYRSAASTSATSSFCVPSLAIWRTRFP